MLISPPFLLKKKASEKREKECTTFAVMADIAILVAEEYERRIKNSRKENDGAERVEGQPAVVSSVSVLAGRIKARVVGHANMEVVKRFGSEPKSQIAVAASNGFFSA